MLRIETHRLQLAIETGSGVFLGGKAFTTEDTEDTEEEKSFKFQVSSFRQ
jgi:hypothetical protein